MSTIHVHIGDCLDVMATMQTDGLQFDAIVTDPPYEIGLHGKAWDQSGIAFSPDLWSRLYDLLKPGGYVVSFAAARLYHRLAVAAEDAGFKLYPFLLWKFPNGLQKPVNVSELFDRDNVPDRKAVGVRKGSGFTDSNVKHGAQNRSKSEYTLYERGVSEEAKTWMGHYYGVNCFKPSVEPILLAQKPIETKRMIDNIRQYGVGALNLDGITDPLIGGWPTTILEHKKARPEDHGSDHPSVKPVPLMEDLIKLVCPPNGRILEPFAGTGTTGVAARKLDRDCDLIEANPEMEAVIRRRCGDPGADPSGSSAP